jgi:hypothetical protein
MTGSLIIIPNITGDVTLTDESALVVSLQGTPSAPFTLTVPTPAAACSYIINNATEQTAFVQGAGGSPAQAPARGDTMLWVDGLGNGHNFA